MVAIFTYGFDLSINNFKNSKCELITLSDYNTLIQQAMDSGFISDKEINILEKWREAPDQW